MSNIFMNNIKIESLFKNELKCKCGSIRYIIEVSEGDNEKNNFNEPWITVICKKCNHILFYNGA